MTSDAEREGRDLALLALLISIDVRHALQSAIVLAASELLFGERPESFATNPANTFIYAAVNALEDRSVVRISECLHQQIKAFAIGSPIRRKADLLMHRNALSHEYKVKWKFHWMQAFHDDDRQLLDVRAALVWDLQRSINERLLELEEKPLLERIDVHPAMAIAIRDIHRLSLRAEHVREIPTEEKIHGHLGAFRERFLDFLVLHPDGRVV